ncbi:MAG: hypothetical protein IJX51_08190 [Clostridia bacterium]|nr:hypothetical protein [Clostridia bacterium]
MDFIKESLKELCSLMTVSGFEKKSRTRLFEIARQYFDEASEDSFGNFIFVKKSLNNNAPRLMIDAHFDMVGMMVTDILEGGFLSVTNIGGLDARILPSAEVTVYGKREIYGLISSIPPHLSKSGKGNVPKIEELYIDTGYSKDELKELVPVGSPVVINGEYTELQNGFVAAASLDDKACVCAIFDAVRRMSAEELKYDIYATVSAQEETGKCGAALSACRIRPRMAIITDVNFGAIEGDKDYDSIVCGKGASVDISALTDRKLTRGVMRLLDKEGVPYQRICEPSYTYTNNDLVSVTGEGIPTVLMSIPLRSMHTPVETVCLKDIRSLADILIRVAYTEKTDLEAI